MEDVKQVSSGLSVCPNGFPLFPPFGGLFRSSLAKGGEITSPTHTHDPYQESVYEGGGEGWDSVCLCVHDTFASWWEPSLRGHRVLAAVGQREEDGLGERDRGLSCRVGVL